MSRTRCHKSLSVQIIVFILFIQHAYAWNDKITHRDISRYSAEISVLGPCIAVSNGCDYARQIGFSLGLKEKLSWNNITDIASEWLSGGGELEDSGTRWLNHFHNPLKPWTEAGLWGVNQSAILWAQSYDMSQQSLAEDWSWQSARKKYYLALTSAEQQTRSKFFAQMFRGIGQQIHLLQDMAVPAHVRNDAHPADALIGNMGDNYHFFETWVATRQPDLASLKSFIPYPEIPAISFDHADGEGGNLKLVPVSNLFDRDLYSTDPVSFAGNAHGLAEWTNSNFFSDDTINLPQYVQNHDFAFPNENSTNLNEVLNQSIFPMTVTAEDGITDTSLWIKKVNSANATEIEHFARFGYLSEEANTTTYHWHFMLDDECHSDYAKALLPRAVGYSAALINYYFRGNITIEPGETNPSKYVIRNDSDEDMTGVFRLYYDNTNGDRVQIASWPSDPDNIAEWLNIPANSASPLITFDDPMDVGEPRTYILVFRGRMGNEEGAVVGRVNKYAPLAISAPDRCLYGLADGAVEPQVFRKLKAKVALSLPPDQAVQSGTLTAIAKYKRRLDYQPDLSADPPSPGVIDPVFANSTSAPVPLTAVALATLPTGTAFSFDFSGSPIPAGITDLYLKVLFRGRDGADREVIAMGWKDLGEPMHHVYWNATDRFYFDDPQRTRKLWTQDEIDGDLPVKEKVLATGLPYWPFAVRTDIAYCLPEGETASKLHVEYASIPPGAFGRVLTITETDDREFNVAVLRRSLDPPDEYASLLDSPTVVNQDQNGVFMYFPVASFRGVAMHAGSAYLKYYPDPPPTLSTLPWPLVPAGTAPVAATVIAH